ncbi:MAG: hypothetical protein PVF77_02325 [Anaerolineae bacterium]|jgi:hypothetical protein
MSGLLKATILILGLGLAAAAVVGLALAWTERPAETSGQTSLATPTSARPSEESQVPADQERSAGTQTATFALG